MTLTSMPRHHLVGDRRRWGAAGPGLQEHRRARARGPGGRARRERVRHRAHQRHCAVLSGRGTDLALDVKPF